MHWYAQGELIFSGKLESPVELQIKRIKGIEEPVVNKCKLDEVIKEIQ